MVMVAALAAGASPAHAADPLSWPVGPTASSQAGRQACASILFVGVRGSGEPVPYGDTVTRLRNNIADATRDVAGTAREVWIDYPAANPHQLSDVPPDALLLGDTLPRSGYFDSVRLGADRLRAVVADSVARCPDELIVVAGFSQGAEVVTLGLTDAEPSHFAGVVTVGNPANSPALVGRRVGRVGDNPYGLAASLFYLRAAIAADKGRGEDNPLGSALSAALDLRARESRPSIAEAAVDAEGTRIRAGFADRWHHVCLGGDMTCDVGPALSRMLAGQASLTAAIDETRPIHLSYNETVLRPATDEVAAQIRARAVEPPHPVEPLPPSTRTWLPWAGLGLFAGGFGLGCLITGRGLRRRRGRE